MKFFNSTTQHLLLGLVLFILTSTSHLFSQNIRYKIVGNDVESRPKFVLRPSVSFSIPPSDLVEGLPIFVSIEAQYWTKMIDYRATGSFGTFKGGAIGATYHLSEKVKVKKEKYVTSRTETKNTTTTKYFKAPANVHRISGPCADFTSGIYGTAGFYSKLDLGWDFQHYGRSYAEYNNRTIRGSSNGWLSLKVQAVLANVAIDMTDYFKLGAGTEKRKTAVGAQVNISGAVRPWKTVTFYYALPLGYMRYMGVANAPETTSKGAPILNIILGTQIKI